MEDRIRKHVEETEFLKEVARREAARLLASADVRELADDPNAFIEQLLAGVLAAIGGRASEMASEARQYATEIGLEALSDAELEQILSDSSDSFIGDAVPLLAAAAEPARQQIERMLDAGVDVAVIEAALGADSSQEALFAPFDSMLR